MSFNITSMRYILIILCILLLLYKCSGAIFTGNKFIANSTGKYHNQTIHCNDNQDCMVHCEAYSNSCGNTIIKCPISGNCDIKCTSGPSNNVCHGISITCPTNGNCNLSCKSDSACKDANINGQTSDSLTTTCEGDSACQNAIINGKDTNDFILECGIGSINTCASLTLFFPPNVNGQKQATIIAGDQCSAGTNDDPMTFYAYNGWNDVNIVNYIGRFEHQLGTMYCGFSYESSCAFKSDAWECENSNIICNNPFNIKQTETRTLSTETTSSQLLYGIISILIICLCCLGSVCLYFFKKTLSQQNRGEAVKNSSSSQIETPPAKTTKLMSINSTSKSSMANTNSIPVTMDISNVQPIRMRSYRSYSTRSTDEAPPINTVNENYEINVIYLETIDSTPQPASPHTNTTDDITTNDNTPIPGLPMQNPATNTNTSSNSANISDNSHNTNPFAYPTPNIIYQHSEVPLPNPQEMISDIDNEQIQIPSTTTASFQPSTTLSSNNGDNGAQIVYQQPPQHQLLQMMSMMNISQPPSLSEFIKNTNGEINQNPIPPTEQSSQRYSGTMSNTGFTNTGTNTKHKTRSTESMTDISSTRSINSSGSLVALQDNENENESESDTNESNQKQIESNVNRNTIIDNIQTAMSNLENNPSSNSEISVNSNINIDDTKYI